MAKYGILSTFSESLGVREKPKGPLWGVLFSNREKFSLVARNFQKKKSGHACELRLIMKTSLQETRKVSPPTTRKVHSMNPHYYLMKSKKILRLEADVSFHTLSIDLKEMLFDPFEVICLDQEQANWRVVIFRDEIMEMDEYTEWLKTAPACVEEEWELEATAN
jgi:hypothetical protein